MYSYNNAKPTPLSKRIVLADGSTRTALHEYDDAALAEWGLVPADPEPVPTSTQVVEWDGNQWLFVDKTAQQLADDLATMRSGMVVTRTQFASACFIAEIITAQECRDWASGKALPANVEAAILAAISDPTEQVIALTKASAEINIRRDNPLIGLLATSPHFDMSDVEVDQLFALAEWVD